MIASNETERQGRFTGSVRAINDDGDIDPSATVGLWRREGSNLRVYGFDHYDLARIMGSGDVDLRKKTLTVKV